MKRRFLIIGLFIVAIGIITAGLLLFKQNNSSQKENASTFKSSDSNDNSKNNPFSQDFSQGKCQGSGTVELASLPMNLEDIGVVLPYGIMVGDHVIPTSHGYFWPAIARSERDKYPVYAIADGHIVNIAHRGEGVANDHDPNRIVDEYQIYFEHSCTFYTYYDLLTSLSPDLVQAAGQLTGFESKPVRIPVKAGQLIGRIGGQTVDFAVWNFEKTPAYFINPSSYEKDRPYLEDMFAYFAEPLKTQLLTKAGRVVEPISGRVNYDISGKLIGGWFLEGSGGIQGPTAQSQEGGQQWDGHLAIAYDYIDPTAIIFSVGNYKGSPAQFGINGNTPDPATITVDSGLIKYELIMGNLIDNDTGQYWMFDRPIANPRFKTEGNVQATVLLQMTAPDRLKLELFPNKTANQITDFTTAAQIYIR